MDKFYIITNSDKDPDFSVTKEISGYLKEHGRECIIQSEAVKSSMGSEYHYTDASQIPNDVDCILVLGGDGTLLQAARDVVEKDIPLLGINMGTLGYLAEIECGMVIPALDHLMNNQYELEERMMLTGTVYHEEDHEEKQIAQDIALNDIVIRRDGPLRVAEFKNYVNGEYLNTCRADGVIISTPTGSTGYSLSAGGPIVSPTASMLLLTAIAPHTLNTRSILFGDRDIITVEIGHGKMGKTEHAAAAFDGDTVIPMQTGDRVVIRKSNKITKIVKINHISFLEILRKKMVAI